MRCYQTHLHSQAPPLTEPAGYPERAFDEIGKLRGSFIAPVPGLLDRIGIQVKTTHRGSAASAVL